MVNNLTFLRRNSVHILQKIFPLTLMQNITKTLLDCLYEHKHVFVTPENPRLGLTQVVEHVIHLKSDAKSMQQRPYRLLSDKKQVFTII